MCKSAAGAEGDEARAYQGRWVARVGGRIIAQGGTPTQARQAAAAMRPKELAEIEYMPTANSFLHSGLLDEIRAVLPEGQPVYLVGGAVRDAMLNRETHDLDFVLKKDALKVARGVANALGANYFPLDEERETARIIRTLPDGTRMWIDFSIFRGADLESDLGARDFTINAMAIDIGNPQALLDPLSGASDLRSKLLRACSPTSMADDPVRILRAVRQAAAFGFKIHPDTKKWMRSAVEKLAQISAERLRDELFRILDGPQTAIAIQALEMLGVLPYLLPELVNLKGVIQSPPHVQDVWKHTLSVLKNLENLLAILQPQYHPDTAASLMMGLVSLRLGRFRAQLGEHLKLSPNVERSLKALLFLAALYHDCAKPQTRQIDENGRIRFINHEEVGSGMAYQRGIALHLSNEEILRLQMIVRNHLRPIHLSQSGAEPTRRAVYRYFRDCGAAGVDICILALADVLAIYETNLSQDVWVRQLDVVRSLLEAWWEYPQDSVSPPALVNGHDIMRELGLKPGPEIGRLLEFVREAQATGQVTSREAALDFVHTHGRD